jgi:hypothetical protein
LIPAAEHISETTGIVIPVHERWKTPVRRRHRDTALETQQGTIGLH